MSASIEDDHVIKPEDVLTVGELLHRKSLPPELIELIIEEAEYWPRIHSERTNDIVVRTRVLAEVGYKAAWCYLLSPPLPALLAERNKMPQKARRVTIKIQAHDQGWASDPSAGAWSWFEAIIIKPHDTQNLPWFSTALEEATDIFDHGDPPVDGTLRTFTRWHVAENAVAYEPIQVHSVVWTKEAEDFQSSNADSPKGRGGLGHELVSSLEPGDRIAILALAQYPSWENHVCSVSIDIEYAA
ncbi:hypothetical protein C8R42DRAFT_668598 [Lentinula raphanica]|nr:hypothetical protein C8R42DRAFT_668598 [Lentinula raphanica]